MLNPLHVRPIVCESIVILESTVYPAILGAPPDGLRAARSSQGWWDGKVSQQRDRGVLPEVIPLSMSDALLETSQRWEEREQKRTMVVIMSWLIALHRSPQVSQRAVDATRASGRRSRHDEVPVAIPSVPPRPSICCTTACPAWAPVGPRGVRRWFAPCERTSAPFVGPSNRCASRLGCGTQETRARACSFCGIRSGLSPASCLRRLNGEVRLHRTVLAYILFPSAAQRARRRPFSHSSEASTGRTLLLARGRRTVEYHPALPHHCPISPAQSRARCASSWSTCLAARRIQRRSLRRRVEMENVAASIFCASSVPVSSWAWSRCIDSACGRDRVRMGVSQHLQANLERTPGIIRGFAAKLAGGSILPAGPCPGACFHTCKTCWYHITHCQAAFLHAPVRGPPFPAPAA